ncbi:MAG: nucleotidyl transferase AbiEii/AbiGii toxin family protein [Dysgonamonadaceae bacterium]|jgi:hypothetical protein|nr:nucleotidyl transferase AbiEii/AbiGii toxin family protein [Dysgonamonadaceae bacterium]
MIGQESITKEWIEKVSKSGKVDKILVEKVIRALMLPEGLSESELDYIFKGGTALMLLFDSGKRLSIVKGHLLISSYWRDINECMFGQKFFNNPLIIN